MKSLDKMSNEVDTSKESQGIFPKKVNKLLIATAFSASLLTGCGGGGGGGSDTSANNTGTTVEAQNAAFENAVSDLELRTLTIDDNANPTDTLSLDVDISGLTEVTFGDNEDNILVTGTNGPKIVLTVSSDDYADVGESVESLSFKNIHAIAIPKDLVVNKVDETPDLQVSNLTCSETVTLGDPINCSAGYNFQNSYTQATAGLYDSFGNLITDFTVTVDTDTKNVVFDQADTASLDAGDYTIKITFEGEGGDQEFEKDLEIIASNTAPTAADVNLNVGGEETITYDLDGDISDTESTDANLTVSVVSGPSHGSLSWNGNEFTYEVTDGTFYAGPDSFTYEVTDEGGLKSTVKTVSMTGIFDF
ncbi:hypothetical protein A9Q91_02110 [Candidatus Gracilibacteria bacterium 28_42_T64]|nr:hypothetical protein A9Q91_02110 [Candidatus Gracilibacteria bacterium 28_42_T64]